MHLITSGCSFSECETTYVDSWPKVLTRALEEKYDVNHTPYGMGSQGNGLISRSVRWSVLDALNNGTDPSDILVGIMWSGTARGEVYVEGDFHIENTDGWKRNPIKMPPSDVEGNWLILNPHWKNEYVKPYYVHKSPAAHSIATLELIIYTQMFLKQHNIKYFMSVYMDEVLKDYNSRPALKWLKDQIDWDTFLPVKGMFDWAKESDLPMGFDGFHPSNEQHQHYVKTIIMPWLSEKYDY
jgi:hypothetical protein